MATTQDFVDHVFEQTELSHRLSARKMFGEFALYLDGKVVALLCDNQVFVKPTPEGRALLGRVTEGFPFPGAKPHLQADEWLDDRERLTQLLLVTHAALPAPKPKAPRKVAKVEAASAQGDQPVTKPVIKSATKSATQSTTKPLTQAATKRVTKPVSQVAAKPAGPAPTPARGASRQKG